MSRKPAPFSLPAPIASKLRSVQRRMTGVGLVTAVVAGAAVLLSAMALAMLVDYLATLYDSAWRGVLTYSAFAMAGVTLAGWAVWAWRRSNHVQQVAREVDRKAPHLEERWSTVAHFAEISPQEGGEVHPAMFRQVADEAIQRGEHVDPSEVVSLSGIVKAFLALNAVTVVLLLAALADWRQTNVLFRRFWAPEANISATLINASPGDTVVGRGEPLVVSASLAGKPVDEATLLLQSEAEGEHRVTLVPNGQQDLSVSHRFRSVKDSFTYRLRGGDGQTPWHEVTVADRPVIQEVRLAITPPEYRRETKKVLKKMPRRLSAVAGSQFELAILPKSPLKSLLLQTGEGAEIELKADADGWHRWRTELQASLILEPLLTEPNGLTLLRPPVTRLHVYPDRPPVVRVISPDDRIAVTPGDTIEIEFVAEDDNGIGAAELVVFQEPLEPGADPVELASIPIELGDDLGKKRVRGKTELDLSEYPLVDGSELSYAVRVVETRSPAAPRVPGGMDQRTPETNQIAGSNDKPREKADQPEADSSEQPLSSPEAEALASSDGPPGASKDDPTEPNQSEPSQNEAGASNANPKSPPIATSNPMAEPNENQLASSASPPSNLANQQNPTKSAGGDKQAVDPQESSQQSPGVAPTNSDLASSETDRENNANDATSAEATGSPTDPTPQGDEAAPRMAQTNENSGTNDANSRPNAEPSIASTNTQATDPADPQNEEDLENRTAESQSRTLLAASSNEDPSSEDESPETRRGDASSSNPTAMAQADSNPAASSANPTENTDPSQNANSANAANTASNNPNASPSQPGGSQNQSSVAQSQPNNSSGSNQNRPGYQMTKRMLDVGAQAAASNQMRLEIDEYAGSFQGQQRAKLEIAIAPELQAIEQHLTRAQNLSQAVLDDLAAGANWQARHHRDIGACDKELKQAQQVARRLQGRTHNTPYAFIGLQISDISAAHVTPARDYFWKSLSSEAGRKGKIRSGWQQVGQALDRVEKLWGRFEATRQEYALADATQRIAKMYRLFVENSMAGPLGGGRGDGGSRLTRKMVEFELDEEYLERLQEVLEMRSELRAEFAKILAEDPRLLRRFMNSFREDRLNLRNQLTELREDQEDLTRELQAWANLTDSQRTRALPLVLRRRLAEIDEFSKETGKLVNRFEAWMPLDADLATGNLRKGLDEANGIAADAREMALQANRMSSQQFNADTFKPLLTKSRALYERLRGFEVLLRTLGSEESMADEANFVINRLADTRRLITSLSSLDRRLNELSKQAVHRAAAIEQYEFATATDELAGKLADLEQQLATLLQTPDGTLPPSIAMKSRALLETLDNEVSPMQLAAAISLERQLWPRVSERQLAASEALKKAEEQFDDLLKAAIAELDELPVQDPVSQLLEDPTLDEILALLENETQLREALGIPRRRSNLQIIDDWIRPGGGNNGGLGMFRRQMQNSQRRMDRASRQAYQRAMQRIRQERVKNSYVAKKKRRAKGKSNDWNVLVSELEDGLSQDRDKLPPERYRTAIEQYHTIMNRAATERDRDNEP